MNHFEKLESYLPLSLISVSNLVLAFGVVLFFVTFRYFALVIPFYLLFYRWKPQWTLRRQIYPKLPGMKEQLFEIKWSLLSAFIFAGAGVAMGLFWELGWTKIYLKFDEYGFFYLLLSLVLLMVIQDTYFYWCHRWLHKPGVYEKYHSVHHASLRPSPWASFSFHPMESLLNAIIVPLMVLILPVHPVILLIHLTVMTISAITNHSGFEVLPSGALRQGWGQWFISGVHHTQHHRYFRTNFGLFFTFWDHLMRTENPKYTQEFNRLFQGEDLQVETQPQVQV